MGPRRRQRRNSLVEPAATVAAAEDHLKEMEAEMKRMKDENAKMKAQLVQFEEMQVQLAQLQHQLLKEKISEEDIVESEGRFDPPDASDPNPKALDRESNKSSVIAPKASLAISEEGIQEQPEVAEFRVGEKVHMRDSGDKDRPCCTKKTPSIGDPVRSKTGRVTDDNDNGDKDAWTLDYEEEAIVVALSEHHDDFKLKNPAGIVSAWQYRKAYEYAWKLGVVVKINPLLVGFHEDHVNAGHLQGYEWSQVQKIQDSRTHRQKTKARVFRTVHLGMELQKWGRRARAKAQAAMKLQRWWRRVRANLQQVDPEAIDVASAAKAAMVTEEEAWFAQQRPFYPESNHNTFVQQAPVQHAGHLAPFSSAPPVDTMAYQMQAPVQHAGHLSPFSSAPPVDTMAYQMQAPVQHAGHLAPFSSAPPVDTMAYQKQAPVQHAGHLAPFSSAPPVDTMAYQMQAPVQHAGHLAPFSFAPPVEQPVPLGASRKKCGPSAKQYTGLYAGGLCPKVRKNIPPQLGTPVILPSESSSKKGKKTLKAFTKLLERKDKPQIDLRKIQQLLPQVVLELGGTTMHGDEQCRELSIRLLHGFSVDETVGQALDSFMTLNPEEVYQLAFSPTGCWAVQLIIEVALIYGVGNRVLANIRTALEGDYAKAAVHQWANFPLQRMLVNASEDMVAQILNAWGLYNVAAAGELVRDSNGCRIFTRLLEFRSKEQAVIELMDSVMLSGLEDLCRHAYGCLTIRLIQKEGTAEQKTMITSVLSKDPVGYANDKHASFLIQHELQCIEQAQRRIDPELNGRAVTFNEMVQGLMAENPDLTLMQCQKHWDNLDQASSSQWTEDRDSLIAVIHGGFEELAESVRIGSTDCDVSPVAYVLKAALENMQKEVARDLVESSAHFAPTFSDWYHEKNRKKPKDALGGSSGSLG